MSDTIPGLVRRLLCHRPAATYIGVCIRTLSSMVNAGEIAQVRFGRGRRKSIRYDVFDLDLWIAAHKFVGGERKP